MPESQPDYRRESAVSEVIGQILIFGILSAVLIMSLLTFGVAKEGAEDRVAQVQGESTVQRVAASVVEVALFAEVAPGDDLAVRSIIDLPDSLEGRAYTLDLDQNEVVLKSGSLNLRAALFQSGAPTNVVICDQSTLIRGGTVAVVVTTADTEPPDCANGASSPPATHFITLESA